MSTEWMWGIGIVVLGIAVAYALMRNRQRTPIDVTRAEAGTKDVYRAEQRKENGMLSPEDRARPMPE